MDSVTYTGGGYGISITSARTEEDKSQTRSMFIMVWLRMRRDNVHMLGGAQKEGTRTEHRESSTHIGKCADNGSVRMWAT